MPNFLRNCLYFHTPEQAYRCFMATDIDCLVVENFVLMKEEQPAALLEDSEAYKAQYALD